MTSGFQQQQDKSLLNFSVPRAATQPQHMGRKLLPEEEARAKAALAEGKSFKA